MILFMDSFDGDEWYENSLVVEQFHPWNWYEDIPDTAKHMMFGTEPYVLVD